MKACVSGICYQKIVPAAAAIERNIFQYAWSENSFYSEVYGKYSIAP